jgi:hypothetical protein
LDVIYPHHPQASDLLKKFPKHETVRKIEFNSVGVPQTRNSLVKGERIIRSVRGT